MHKRYVKSAIEKRAITNLCYDKNMKNFYHNFKDEILLTVGMATPFIMIGLAKLYLEWSR